MPSTQVPPFSHWLPTQSSLLTSQLSPEKPDAHWHVYVPTPLTHVPPL